MNRRKFLQLLGKGAIASGVAVASGNPEANEIIDNPNTSIETAISLDEYARLMGIKLPLSQDFFAYIGGSIDTPYQMYALDENDMKWFSDDGGTTWMLASPSEV